MSMKPAPAPEPLHRLGRTFRNVGWHVLHLAVMALPFVSGCRSCRPHQLSQHPSADAGASATASRAGTTAMPIFLEIIGPPSAFSGLPSIPGLMLEDHGRQTLPDGRWRLATYAVSTAVVDQIRALGLEVGVLQTEAEVQAEWQRIADKVRDGGGGKS